MKPNLLHASAKVEKFGSLKYLLYFTLSSSALSLAISIIRPLTKLEKLVE